MSNYKNNYSINTLNQLAKALGGDGNAKYPISALNDIAAALGGENSKYPIDALNIIAESIDNVTSLVVEGAGYRKDIGGVGTLEYRAPTVRDGYYYMDMYMVKDYTIWDSGSKETSLQRSIMSCFRFVATDGKKYCFVPYEIKTAYTTELTYQVKGRLYQQVGKSLELLTGDEDVAVTILILCNSETPVTIEAAPERSDDIPIKIELRVESGILKNTVYEMTQILPSFNIRGWALSTKTYGSGNDRVVLFPDITSIYYFGQLKSIKIAIRVSGKSVTLNSGDIISYVYPNNLVTLLLQRNYVYEESAYE